MVATNQQPVTWCDDCEIQYPGNEDTPCPVCPSRGIWSEARNTIRQFEPIRVTSYTSEWAIQDALNTALVEGWKLRDFKVGYTYSGETGDGGPVFVAVLERATYLDKDHSEAIAREREACKAYWELRTETENATRTAKEAGSCESRSPAAETPTLRQATAGSP